MTDRELIEKFIGFYPMADYKDWRHQIRVWSKLCRENHTNFALVMDYYDCIDNDDSARGYDIIIKMLKEIYEPKKAS